jgi:hypothetical protein
MVRVLSSALLQSATRRAPVKGTVVITLKGCASHERVLEWKRGVESIFKPQRSGGGGAPGRLLWYYLCDSISSEQVKALVVEFGGIVIRRATEENVPEPMLLGKYGNCIFEIPDDGETWRLRAPPNTFRVDYYGVPAVLENLSPSEEGRTHVILMPNHNGGTVDVACSQFHFESPPKLEAASTLTTLTDEPLIGMYVGPSLDDSPVKPQEDLIPATLDEAVDTLIRQMEPEQREDFRRIPRERLVGETHRSIGMGIRNGWQLWDKNSGLMRQFPGKEADDVSSIIIETAWEKVQIVEEPKRSRIPATID